MRKYGREDVDYATWYTPWMKMLAAQYTLEQLIAQLNGTGREASKAAKTHLRAIERTGSMQGASAARAHGRNSVAAAGDRMAAISGAIEIHELFPEYAHHQAMGPAKFRPVSWCDLHQLGAPVIGWGIARKLPTERRYKPVGYLGQVHPFATKKDAQKVCEELSRDAIAQQGDK